MKNLRTCLITAAEVKLGLDPSIALTRMKAAGFKFDQETCPIKIKAPWDMVDGDDGSITYRQWDPTPSFDVFYMRPEYFRHGIMGYGYLKGLGMLPNPLALIKTHLYVKMTEAKDLEQLFQKMQGEVWSPNGEARALIESRGLKHTSMSVGDVAVDADGAVWIVDNFGFKKLN